ncbi:hypothetical protein, partial [Okeania sp. SIO2B9]|uniref:hypothetical protein n=1 Tax=Okeania sp. SIO2B9 TaxID=2607782 RepID=UPI00142A3C86
MKKEDTGFIVFKKEFSGSFQSLKSIVKFLLYNPGFAYLVARGIKLILEDGWIILSGLCIGTGIGGIVMYALIPFLDESGKNEGLNFYLYFCFLQGIMLPIMFGIAVVKNFQVEAVLSIVMLGIELAKFTFW